MKFDVTEILLGLLLLGASFFTGAEAVTLSSGYLLALNPGATTPYHPASEFSFNSAGGPINITRNDVGQYSNAFTGLCLNAAGLHSFTIASGYGSDKLVCKI